jgi:hypothetical protein
MSGPWWIRATLRAIVVRDRGSSILRTRSGIVPTVLLSCIGLSLPSTRAFALDLVWDAPAGCPDRAAVMEHIQRRDATLDDSAWSAQAHVTRTRSRYTLELILSGPNEQMARRTLTSASCAALAETTAVMVHLALEAAQEAPASAPAANGGDEQPPPATVEPVPAAAVSGKESPAQEQAAPAPARARALPQPTAAGASQPLRLALELGASFAVRAGMLAGGPRAGVRPELALRLGRLRAALAADLWFAGASQPAEYPSARVSDQALGGDLTVGFDLTRTRFVPRPSLGLEVSEIRLRTTGISAPGDVRATWIAVGAGIQLEYRLFAGFTPSLGLFGFVPLGRAQFLLQTPRGRIELFTPSPLGLRASLGVAYVFQ